MNVDHSTLASIASITAAFGGAVLVFRIQRELSMEREGERLWLPIADRLLVAATLISLLLVIVPLIFLPRDRLSLPAAASAASAVLVAGYVLAILGHYRITFSRRFVVFGEERMGPYDNPEPSERFFAISSVIAAVTVFVARLFI